MPGQTSRPAELDGLGFGRDRGAGRADRRDPAVGDDQGPPLDLGSGDRVEVGADQREEALGLSGDLDRPVAQRLGRRRHRRVAARSRPQPAPRLVPLEEYLAVDQGQLAARERVERMAVVKHDIRVLADFDRAQPAVQPELAGRVDRDHGQRRVSETPPYLTILAASRFRWRISSASSLLMQTLAPASVSSAALNGMAS